MSEDTAVVNPKVSIDVAQERRKPRLEALLFCDYVAITNEQKAVLGGVFDRFYITPDDKTVAFSLYIRTAETREPMQLSIFGPDNTVGATGVLTPAGSFPEEEGKVLHVQLTLEMHFEAQVEGIYYFDVSYKGESLGGSSFKVIMRKEEE